MCGIVGYYGNKNALSILLNGLKKLEYRGYDSAGIAISLDNGIAIFKEQGKVSFLEQNIPSLYSNVGIGHTRWATHGRPSSQNAHPHFSSTRRFCIVHNGIIENYLELKNKYLSKIKFSSETDSEVFVNLIEHFYNEYNDVLKALIKVKSLIKGSYAILLLDDQNLKRIYFIKNQTPLWIGKNNKEIMFASDGLAFNKKICNALLLSDGDYGFIDSQSLFLFDKNDDSKQPSWMIYDNSKNDVDKGSFSHHMLKEINDQPSLIDSFLENYLIGNDIYIPEKIKNKIKNSDTIYIIACGSSYYAGLMGKQFFQKHTSKKVEVYLASEILYQFPIISKNPYFIFVSQSGETLDVINILKQCKELNYDYLGISNAPSSTLDYLCQDVLYLYAGREISVASTKAFLGQSLLFYLLSRSLEDKTPGIKKDLLSLKESIINTLKNPTPIQKVARNLINKKDVFYLGRNIDYNLAKEAALKLKEVSYIHAEAFPSGELKHGSIALLDENAVVIGLMSQDQTASIMRTNLAECEVRGAYIYTITCQHLSNKNDSIILDDLPSSLRPLSLVVVVQLIAYYTALYKELDIDQPRNLAKSVTVE